MARQRLLEPAVQLGRSARACSTPHGRARTAGSSRPARRRSAPRASPPRCPASAPGCPPAARRRRGARRRGRRTASHLFSASTAGAALALDQLGELQVLVVQSLPTASTLSTTTSAIFSAPIAAPTDSFSSGASTRARRRSPAVSTSSIVAPSASRSTHRDRVAGQPRLRPGDHPLLAEQPVQQRGFAGIRPPDDGQLQRPLRFVRSARLAASAAAGRRFRAIRSEMPSPCSAETASGSPSPSA